MKRRKMFHTRDPPLQARMRSNHIVICCPGNGAGKDLIMRKKLKKAAALLMAAALALTGAPGAALAAVPSVEAQHKAIEKPTIKVPEAESAAGALSKTAYYSSGNPLSSYNCNGVKVEQKDFNGPVIPSEYTLNATFTPGKTTVQQFGCGNTKNDATAVTLREMIAEDENLHDRSDVESRYAQNRYVKILKEGTSAGFGVRYNNVGVYTENGKDTTVDMKMTITDYKLMDGHSPKLGAVAFDVGKNSDADGNGSLGIMLSCVDWVRVKLEYFVHGTNTPMSVKGYNTLGDIDGLQGVAFLSTPKNIYVHTGNTFLQWKNYAGSNFIFGASPSSGGQIDSTPLLGQLAWTFAGTSQEFLYTTCVEGATHDDIETDDLASMKKNHLSYYLFNGRAYFYYEAEGMPKQEFKGSVTVIKKDSKTGAVLPSAGFTLYKKENGNYISQGELAFRPREEVYQRRDLIPGDYRVTETKFPTNYIVEREPWSQDFTVTEDAAAQNDFTYTVPNTPVDPKISISKLADRTTGVELVDGRYQGEKKPGWYRLGEEAVFKMVVRNYGNVTAKNLKVVDTMEKELQDAVQVEKAAFSVPEGVKTEKGKDVKITADSSTQLTIDRLEPDDSVVFNFKVTLKEKDIPVLEKLQNVVKVTGEYENGDETKDIPEDEDDTDEDKINVADPKISVSKLADRTTGVKLVDGRYEGEKQPGWYKLGEEAVFKIIVRNYGNVSVKNLKVADTMAEDLKNAVKDASAAFSIPEGVKTDKGKNVKITVDSPTQVTIDTLEPGDSVAFDFKVTLKEKDIPVLEKLQNLVKVTGEYSLPDREDKPVPEDEDDTDEDKINVADPKISVSKLADRTTGVTLVDGRYEGEKKPGWYSMGEEAVFKIIVRNYGNVEAKDLKVVDTMTEDLKKAVKTTEAAFSIPEGLKTEKGKDVKVTLDSTSQASIDRLEPGDSVTFHFKVVLKDKGIPVLENLKNLVKVTGKYQIPGGDDEDIPPDGDDEDEDRLNVADPKISVSKLADKTTGVTLKDGRYEGEKKPGTYEPGSKVRYKIIVRNYGNVAAESLTVTDSMDEELKKAAKDAGFVTEGKVKTEKGKTAKVSLDGKTKASIDTLEPGDSVELAFEVELKSGLSASRTLDNKVKVTGKYKVPGGKDKKIPEDKDDTDNDKIRTPEKAVTPPTDVSTPSTPSPKTGDATKAMPYLALAAVAAALILYMLYRRKKAGR